MKYIFLIISMILLSQQSSADLQAEIEETKTGYVSMRTFPSIEDVAIYTARIYNKSSIQEDVEYIGAIIQNEDNRYYFTANKGKKRKSHSIAKLYLPKNHTLSAVWHTHGGKRWNSRYFSDIDTNIANSLKLPVYMINSDNILRVFYPGDKTLTKFDANKLGLGKFSGYAEGTTVVDL